MTICFTIVIVGNNDDVKAFFFILVPVSAVAKSFHCTKRVGMTFWLKSQLHREFIHLSVIIHFYNKFLLFLICLVSFNSYVCKNRRINLFNMTCFSLISTYLTVMLYVQHVVLFCSNNFVFPQKYMNLVDMLELMMNLVVQCPALVSHGDDIDHICASLFPNLYYFDS